MRHSKLVSPLGPHSWKPRNFSIFDKMREHWPIKIGHFSIFKVNILYQKSSETLWKWFSLFNMWIVEHLLLLSYYHMLQFWSTLFCKNVPNFWWLCAHWFWKIWKNHLSPINMDLQDYSILGVYLQIVLPWITIMCTHYLLTTHTTPKWI